MTKLGHFPGWDEIDGSSVSPEEVESAYLEVMARVAALEEYLKEQRRRRRLILRHSLMAAAAVAALILVPFISYRYVERRASSGVSEPVCYLQCSTTCGETRDIVLPDHSIVTLNAQSVLIYPASFGKDRQVFLSGEARFDVTASEESPFLVQTADITVRVHGTLFNVNAYFDHPQVTATLNRGVISVWPNDSPERAVELEADQQFSYERATGAITTAHVRSQESLSWADGDLFFHSASIHDIIRVVERHFGVTVYLTSDRYDNALITASFVHNETVDELMDAICGVVPHMKYIHTDQSIFIQ